MSKENFMARHRWFILGLFFLFVNSYAVWLYHGSLNDKREPRAELVAPADGRASGRDALCWRFSSDMAAPAATGAWFAAGPVKFYPDVKGVFCWTSPRELVFRPDSEWAMCTDFKALFCEELRDVDLKPLSGKKSFEFRSDSLALKGVSQTDFSESGGLRLALEFNAAVSPAALQAALAVVDSEGRPVAYRIEQQTLGKTIAVVIPREPPREIILHLREGLQALAGPRGLEQAVSFRVKPARELRLAGMSAETTPFGPNSIYVSFNRPVVMEALREFVRVEPAAEFTVEAGGRYYWESQNTFRLLGDFKPNKSYTVTLLRGLPGSGGTSLDSDVARVVYLPSPEPGLEITAVGNYLSPLGGMELPFRTAGLTKCRAALRRVYPNNLVFLATRKLNCDYRYWWLDYPGEGLDRGESEQYIPIEHAAGGVAEHRLALRELTGGKPGVYYVALTGTNGKDWLQTHCHVVVSDIGLLVRRFDREMLVWANSIRTLEPVSGAEVKVFSAENQELFSGTADAEGLVRFTFEPALPAGAPFLVTAQKGDDMTYLALAETEVEAKGGVGERPFLAEGYEAYLFTDRGIYRPGETAHLKAIVREKDAACPPAFPVRLNVYRPDGRLEKSLNAVLSDYGTAEFGIEWPEFAATGRRRLELALPAGGAPLGEADVAVEEFVPPQIRVEARPASESRRAGEEIGVDVRADYLFGRPASGLAAELRAEFVPQPVAFPQFPGFVFGDAAKRFIKVQEQAGSKPLDEDGRTRFALKTSAEWRPPAALKAVIAATVMEIGGRGVTAYASCRVDAYPFYIGLRRLGENPGAGSDHAFEAVAVNPDGTLAGGVERLKLKVEKLSWSTVLKQGPGSTYTYSSEQQASPVLAEQVSLKDGKGTISFKPAVVGDYRLSLSDPASGASSSVEFYAGSPGQEWQTRSMASPAFVELAPDKARYAPGETAVLVIKSPFPGKALVTIESVGVLESRVLELDKNTAELRIPVKPEYAPNVYCSVTVIRPAVSEKIWGHHRASGLVPLAVDAPALMAEMSISAPDAIRPCTALDIDIAIGGSESGGAPFEVVVAAVDEGICTLTDFKSPDPYGYFMAARRAGSRLHDLYSLLIPELENVLGGEPSSPGGDIMAGLGRRLNPVKSRRFKPLALWSSTVMTDAAGRAGVRFEIPEFTGQLRLMAVAVGKQRFASAEKRVSVARPLVVQSSLPRFVAPSDRFSMPVQIINETGAAGEAVARVLCSGPLVCEGGNVSATARVNVTRGTVTNIVFNLEALPAVGNAKCVLELEMAGEHFSEETELPVRPPAGRAVAAGAGRVEPGSNVKLDMPENLLQGTAETGVWLSALPAVELGSSLAYLLEYPYGCLEQTVSRSFPLLYLHELAARTQPGWLERGDTAQFVQAGLSQMLAMQREDGSFGLWRGCDSYTWGSIYATHFLAAACKAGYTPPAERLKAACDWLESWLASQRTSAGDAWSCDDVYNRAYACYALAVAGRPQYGWMARLCEQEQKLDRDARICVAAALLVSGKRREANALLKNIEPSAAGGISRQAGGSLRSDARADAMLLSAWLELDPENAAIPGLVRRLEACRENGRWHNTQENAMALMALGQYCSSLEKDRRPISGSIEAGGVKLHEFAGKYEYHAGALPGGAVTLVNSGAGPIYYYWKSEGVPLDGRVAEEDCGLKARRELLDLNGNPPAPGALRQGELLVMKVTLETDSPFVENIVVEDLLPAGLEIENANLKTSGVAAWCKDKQTLELLHADVRDDRMVAFPGRFSGRREYFYAVRAVTQGEFAAPPIMAVCMYDPGIRSVHGAGRIRVVGEEQ